MKFLLLLICQLHLFATETVFVSILARNKAHVLPKYLECIENLDYDKSAITIYINTNNNDDATEEILEEWAKKHEDAYHEILFENHNVKELDKDESTPHRWSTGRFKVLGMIRTKSLRLAEEKRCDFYFVVDCDNFITQSTLKTLVAKDKPMIAPMLSSFPEKGNSYSNFFYDIDTRGYAKYHPEYFSIFNRTKVGTFEVPVIHCTYLIRKDALPYLKYVDETDDYEFVILSRVARENNIPQFICNEENFGALVHIFRELTWQEEAELIKPFLSIP